jgi:hypothetical protein
VTPGAQDGLLHEVLGLLERAEHAVAVHPQFRSMTIHEGGEGGLVTGARCDQGLVPLGAG